MVGLHSTARAVSEAKQMALRHVEAPQTRRALHALGFYDALEWSWTPSNLPPVVSDNLRAQASRIRRERGGACCRAPRTPFLAANPQPNEPIADTSVAYERSLR